VALQAFSDRLPEVRCRPDRRQADLVIMLHRFALVGDDLPYGLFVRECSRAASMLTGKLNADQKLG